MNFWEIFPNKLKIECEAVVQMFEGHCFEDATLLATGREPMEWAFSEWIRMFTNNAFPR